MQSDNRLNNTGSIELEALYAAREESGLGNDPDTCVVIAQRALSEGAPLLAYDLCRFVLHEQPTHSRLRQMQALALARCGAVEQAMKLIEELHGEGARDAESLGLLARLYKDRALEWFHGSDTRGLQAMLAESLRLYREAYETYGLYWSGINAATIALTAGDHQQATEIALRVREQCLAAEMPASNFWLLATLGEAALILGELEQARVWYGKAVVAGAGFGDRASMRRNARLVLISKNIDPEWLERVLPRPAIAIFSGHMPDSDDRTLARFPENVAARVGEVIRARLKDDDIQIGYASAASGGDILFHEAMLALGRETHVVLPEPPESFAKTSVIAVRPTWFDRFQGVLDRAASVIVHSNSGSGNIGYAYNNWMILGLARLRAQQVDGEVRSLALWDGQPGPPGGTSSAVVHWQAFGEVVDCLAPMTEDLPAWKRAAGVKRTVIEHVVGTQRIIAMLFADAVGFSKLADEQIPAFVQHFLGMVAAVLDRQAEPALTRNTWGDGLYFCFATPRTAGVFALDLCEAIRSTDWESCGLPAGLSLRIALHCGPAHEVSDPVIRRRNFTGAHVSRAARIEPVTPPGSVYASQSFAAMCACEEVSEFACEYVGRLPLAKKFGEYPMYSLRLRQN